MRLVSLFRRRPCQAKFNFRQSHSADVIRPAQPSTRNSQPVQPSNSLATGLLRRPTNLPLPSTALPICTRYVVSGCSAVLATHNAVPYRRRVVSSGTWNVARAVLAVWTDGGFGRHVHVEAARAARMVDSARWCRTDCFALDGSRDVR